MTRVTPFQIAFLGFCLLMSGCKQETKSPDPSLMRFAQARQAQAESLVKAQDLDMPTDGRRLFRAVLEDDYATATNLFIKLQTIRSGSAPTNPIQDAIEWSKTKLEERGYYSRKSSALNGPAWHMMVEAYWAYRLGKEWHTPYLEMAVQGMLEAIPTNAIYFGGTDVGRFAVLAAAESRLEGKSFFAITHMQLADSTYLDYLPLLCGTNLTIPSLDDCSKAYASASATGRVTVTEMNARLVRWIFERNPGREVFIEQSPEWPVEWVYPYLIPHGPIFKINREPLSRIDDARLQADRAFWNRWCGRLIGAQIKPQATVTQVCEFVERIYVRNDLHGFAGDAAYLSNIHARNYFGWLRHLSANLYLWRCVEANDVAEKERMQDESILAYQQAFALDPLVAMDFADLLRQINRSSDARRVLEISTHVNPGNTGNTDAKAMLERLMTTEKKGR